jgi:membrane protease YdiL (CAAX protease family)
MAHMITASRSARLTVGALGVAFVVAGLLLLDLLTASVYSLAVVGIGVGVALASALLGRRGGLGVVWLRASVDLADIAVIVVLYGAVVGGFRLAFTVFTVDNTLGLFLSFAAALLLGVVGPIVYSVLLRRRPLASLGIGIGDWRITGALALLFGGVQFAITLARTDYPAVETWLPLLVMALAVGIFESVFFRGFVQNRLEDSFGLVPAVAVAAGFYGLYHVGYGMGLDEIGFLLGLGVVYAVAFRLAGSILVLWPLLTPLGSFFSQLQAGDLVLPMEAILGFADVLGLMVAAIWLATRYERRRHAQAAGVDVSPGSSEAIPHAHS